MAAVPFEGKLLVAGGIEMQLGVYDVVGNTFTILASESHPVIFSYVRIGDELIVQTMNPYEAGEMAFHVTDGTPEGTRELEEISDTFLFLLRTTVNDKALLAMPAIGQDAVGLGSFDLVSGQLDVMTVVYGVDSIGFEEFFCSFDPNYRKRSVVTLGNGSLLFVGNSIANGEELWITDGTANGTVMLKDINPGVAGSMPINLTLAGDLVYFAADDGVHGRELWQTDGTAAGTVMVADLYAGEASGLPGPDFMTPTSSDYLGYYHSAERGMVYNRGQLLFPGNSGAGFELWMIREAGADPERIDLLGGFDLAGRDLDQVSPDPSNFVLLGDRVFFQATTPHNGRDLWSMPLGQSSSVNDWALY